MTGIDPKASAAKPRSRLTGIMGTISKCQHTDFLQPIRTRIIVDDNAHDMRSSIVNTGECFALVNYNGSN
jgi:hypothetical protein